jgi:uncharacterized membrane-anchored protein
MRDGQCRRPRRLAIVMVAVFGTMVADVLHVVLGIPYNALPVAGINS